jgi:hypothetical protein
MVVLLLCANCMGCAILNATPEYMRGMMSDTLRPQEDMFDLVRIE